MGATEADEARGLVADKKERAEPLPYYRWYWRDWRASRAVQRMRWEARGLYRELLDECWSRGCIPDDAAACAEIAGCPVKVMQKHWPEIREQFVSVGDGLLVNTRLENERTESDRLRVVRSVNGRRGAEAKWQNLANAGKSQQSLANDGNLLSSSSSSSEQSKSSSVRQEDPERLPVAALAPQGARAPGSKSGMMSLADVDWRSQFTQAGAEKPRRIGFQPESES